MKRVNFKFNAIIIAILFCISIQMNAENSTKTKNPNPEYRNFYGICWDRNAHQNLVYARQMGYDYVFYQHGMEDDSLSNDLYFYLESPEFNVYPRYVYINKTYTEKEISEFLTNSALKDTTSKFPYNIATGWFVHNGFSTQLDFQQKRIVEQTVDSILKYVNFLESKNPRFHFGGFAWDVPDLQGDFWNGEVNVKKGLPVGLAYFTGGDFSIRYGNTVHDYATHSDGTAEFYKLLFNKAREKYPHMKTIMEPYSPYDHWINKIRKRADAKEIMPDIISQENKGTQFVDDERILASGLIDKEHLCSTPPALYTDSINRVHAAKAAINKAWFNWYGRFGGTGDMPSYKSIVDVPARLKLIRVLANWENVNKTPQEVRKWDGTVYQSPTAFVSPDVISIIQPKTGKLFFVLLKQDGAISLPKGKKIKAIYSTDGLFCEMKDANADFSISKNSIKPINADALLKCYIVHFK
ncbi:MAG: hypothetical protein ACOYMD_04885 [Paludibacter sp.]